MAYEGKLGHTNILVSRWILACPNIRCQPSDRYVPGLVALRVHLRACLHVRPMNHLSGVTPRQYPEAVAGQAMVARESMQKYALAWVVVPGGHATVYTPG
jgi:hypothetical protein